VHLTTAPFTSISKNFEHHTAMQAVFAAWYNLCRNAQAMKGARPAIASKLTNHVWTMKELIESAAEARQIQRNLACESYL
jgi:hypothetical protein